MHRRGSNDGVPPGVDLDLAGQPRFRDDPKTRDTGSGAAPIVDMGALEHQPPCDADVDGDGVVDVDDLVAVILAWGPCGVPEGCAEDIDQSGFVDVDDLVAVILGWGPCE